MTTSSLMLESFVVPFAIYLKSLGYNVEFACTDYMPRNQVSKINDLKAKGFVVHKLDFKYHVNLLSDSLSVFKIIGFLRKNKYDLVHIQSSKAGILGRIASSIANVKLIIFTANDFYYLDNSLNKLQRYFYFVAEKVTSYFCDAIFFISTSVLEEAKLKRLKSPDKLFYTGPPTQDYSKFVKEEKIIKDIRNKYNLVESDIFIGCVARLVYNKGIDIFIKVAQRICSLKENVKFIIVGDGELNTELKNMVDKFQLNEKVFLTGFIKDYTQVLNIMSSLDIFFLPTRREGFGLVFAEALAFEVPVVGPDIAPINEFICNNKTGMLCKNEDVEDFADAVLKLSENYNLRKELGVNGRIQICSDFDQKKYFDRTIDLYTKVLQIKGTK